MFNRIIKKLAREESGSVMLIVAAGMVVFLGLTAMVVDVGRAESRKFKLANTMDAAALAGVQDLPVSTTVAKTKALEIVVANGFNPSAVNVEFLDGNKKIRVTSSETVDTLFAGVIGVYTMDVSAKAAAEVKPISGVTGIVPVGLSDEIAEDIAYGELAYLKVGANMDDPLLGDKGWYGALTLNKPGAKSFETNMAYGYDGVIRIGEIILTETGNMAGPTVDGVETRLLQCSKGCTFSVHDSDCPRIVLVPVYQIDEVDDKNQVKSVIVVGFASFWIESSSSEGTGGNATATITGRFLKTVSAAEISASAPDYGAYGSRLSE